MRFILFLPVILTAVCSNTFTDQASFSFESINTDELISPHFVKADDGTRIAFYSYEAYEPVASLIFVHGGGAHSGAGYQYIARQLSQYYRISVFLTDLRGHGHSEGERGHSPEPDTLFSDMNRIISEIRSTAKQIPVFLGGHSSGAGFLLNYSHESGMPAPRGYIFLAPEFGFRSETARESRLPPFADANIVPFLLSEVSGRNICGSCKAVTFNYPAEILRKDPLLLSEITVNMAYALTPENPRKQFTALNAPATIIIGKKDELISPAKLAPFVSLIPERFSKNSSLIVLPEAKHLSILNRSPAFISAAIRKNR